MRSQLHQAQMPAYCQSLYGLVLVRQVLLAQFSSILSFHIFSILPLFPMIFCLQQLGLSFTLNLELLFTIFFLTMSFINTLQPLARELQNLDKGNEKNGHLAFGDGFHFSLVEQVKQVTPYYSPWRKKTFSTKDLEDM